MNINRLLRKFFIIGYPILFCFAQCFAIDPIERIEIIVDAKMVISEMIDHNPTLTFHDEFTAVNTNIVTLKFSFQDKKGVTFTYILDVIVPKGDKNNEKTV